MTNFAEVSKGRNYFGWGRILILPQGAWMVWMPWEEGKERILELLDEKDLL
jgi:hypothetical protein